MDTEEAAKDERLALIRERHAAKERTRRQEYIEYRNGGLEDERDGGDGHGMDE